MTKRLGLVPGTDSFLSLFPETKGIDRFFSGFWPSDFFADEKEWIPAFDVTENEKEYVINGELPGIESKDLDISLLDGILTIKGEKKQEKEEKEENYHRVERRYGSFSRSFRVPENVRTDELDAGYKDGVLKLTLPKKEETTAKKIEVKDK
jgi:HSP20 family protein